MADGVHQDRFLVVFDPRENRIECLELILVGEPGHDIRRGREREFPRLDVVGAPESAVGVEDIDAADWNH